MPRKPPNESTAHRRANGIRCASTRDQCRLYWLDMNATLLPFSPDAARTRDDLGCLVIDVEAVRVDTALAVVTGRSGVTGAERNRAQS